MTRLKNFSVLFIGLAIVLFCARPAAAIGVVQIRSPGGISAYFSEDHTTPVIAISFRFEGGTALDSADKQGLSNLGMSLLDEGAGDMDSFAFQSALENNAITFSASAERDALVGEVLTTTPSLGEAARLTSLALTKPRFDPSAVERVRREVLVEIASEAGVPGHIASLRLFSDLFGNHPYARDEEGTTASVTALTRTDVQNWAKTRLARDRLVVGIAGDLSPQKAAHILDQIFGGLPATSSIAPKLPEAQVSTAPRTDRVIRDLTQTTIYIGAPGIARNDPDWYAATVADYIFGAGSFSSRLMNEVREKRGLAYTVRSELVPFDYGPIMVVAAGTRADQAEKSLAVIRNEWAKMTEPGVTQSEIDGAKEYLTGAWPLRFTSTEKIADLLVQIQHDHLGLDYLQRHNKLINAVTLDDVRRVAKRLYKPDQLTVVMVGRAPAEAKAESAGSRAPTGTE